MIRFCKRKILLFTKAIPFLRPVLDACHSKITGYHHLTRAYVAIVQDGKILCVKLVNGTERQLILPGGLFEKRDRLPYLAAHREVEEEVGVSVQIGPSSLIGQWNRNGVIEELYLPSGWRGTPKAGGEIEGIQWLSEEESYKYVAPAEIPKVREAFRLARARSIA